MKLDRSTREAIRQQLDEAIAARAEQLRTMTPAERQAFLRGEQEERERQQADAALVDAGKLTEVMSALEAFGARRRPVDAEALAEHRWQTRGVRDMKAYGVPERHRIRLLKFDNAQKAKKFERIKELCCGTGAVVALCGMRGAGKSTLACQVMRERVEAAIAYDYADPRPEAEPIGAGRYRKLVALGAHFKLMFAGHGGVNQDVLEEQYQHLCSHPLLVIDELHDAEGIGPTTALLVDLIDRRYAENRDTILITNREAASFRENPAYASIVSRSSEHGATIDCSWGSSRNNR